MENKHSTLILKSIEGESPEYFLSLDMAKEIHENEADKFLLIDATTNDISVSETKLKGEDPHPTETEYCKPEEKRGYVVTVIKTHIEKGFTTVVVLANNELTEQINISFLNAPGHEVEALRH